MRDGKETSLMITNVERYNDTPFSIVKTNKEDERNHFIGIANKRVSDYMSREECEDAIDAKDWWLITMTIVHLMENAEQIQTITQKLTGGKDKTTQTD